MTNVPFVSLEALGSVSIVGLVPADVAFTEITVSNAVAVYAVVFATYARSTPFNNGLCNVTCLEIVCAEPPVVTTLEPKFNVTAPVDAEEVRLFAVPVIDVTMLVKELPEPLVSNTVPVLVRSEEHTSELQS